MKNESDNLTGYWIDRVLAMIAAICGGIAIARFFSKTGDHSLSALSGFASFIIIWLKCKPKA